MRLAELPVRADHQNHDPDINIADGLIKTINAAIKNIAAPSANSGPS
jgi:hypothetical protein